MTSQGHTGTFPVLCILCPLPAVFIPSPMSPHHFISIPFSFLIIACVCVCVHECVFQFWTQGPPCQTSIPFKTRLSFHC